MKIQRTIPPTAAPINLESLIHGFAGIFSDQGYMKRLEGEIKEYFCVRHVFLVSSGKAALTIILRALSSLAQARNEVLIPAYTCFSVPSAIIKAGLKISLCDIDPSTLDFDYELLDKSINENTLCVISNHLFGIPSDMDRINPLCRSRGIFVVEDAAQAMGGVYKGKKLGTIEDVGFFSLGRGKNITCGSGGIIVTNSDEIASAINREYFRLEEPGILESIMEYIKVLNMSLFIHPSLYWFPSDLPFLRLGETFFYRDFSIKRLSGMKAGLLRHWRERLEYSNRVRMENTRYFCERPALKGMDSIPYLRLPVVVKDKRTREKISFISREKGLGVSKMYPTPVSEIEEIRDQFNGRMFPSAREISEELLTLPTHQFLSGRDREEICKLLENPSINSEDSFNLKHVLKLLDEN